MKITIDLTEAEVSGIKKYLKEVDDIKKPSKTDIKNEVVGTLKTYFHSNNALSDYIKQAEENV